MKNFTAEFDKFLGKLKRHEPFAFSRWADGELWILENKSYSLSPSSYGYLYPEDQKEFDASKHQFHREKLWDAFQYAAPNYYIGITTNSDAGIVGYSPRDWMIENSGSNIDHTTFANLFINSNYRRFREEVIPLFSEYKTVAMCNQRSTFRNCPFKIEKDFRIGSNCIINDDDKVDLMAKWVEEQKPEGWLFLFAASSLGNLCIHRLHQIAPNNTYIDVGSALNPDFGLGLDRGYLSAWAGMKQRGMWDTSSYLTREETW
jgi:hypothetical protein